MYFRCVNAKSSHFCELNSWIERYLGLFFMCQTWCRQAVNLTEFYESSAWVGKKLAVPLKGSNFGRQYAKALYEAGVSRFSDSIFCLRNSKSLREPWNWLVCFITVLAQKLNRNCMDSCFFVFFVARKVLLIHSRACGWWRMALGWLERAWYCDKRGWQVG